MKTTYQDNNGLRWHRLSEIVDSKGPMEVMAATCMDGIGVIVIWVRRADGNYDVSALDTEGQAYEAVNFELEENELIPAAPPKVWDDALRGAHATEAVTAADDEVKKPRLFYYEEAARCWTPAPDRVEDIVDVEGMDPDDREDTINIEFRRADLSDREIRELPDC